LKMRCMVLFWVWIFTVCGIQRYGYQSLEAW
jgi:hypothetical protein